MVDRSPGIISGGKVSGVLLRHRWVVAIADEAIDANYLEPGTLPSLVNAVSPGLLEADERGVTDCIICNRRRPGRFGAIGLIRSSRSPEILLAFICPACTPRDDTALFRLMPAVIKAIWPDAILVPAANFSPEEGRA